MNTSLIMLMVKIERLLKSKPIQISLSAGAGFIVEVKQGEKSLIICQHRDLYRALSEALKMAEGEGLLADVLENKSMSEFIPPVHDGEEQS